MTYPANRRKRGELAAEWRANWPSEVPYGDCWCGCGEKTTIAKQSGSRSAHGEPFRYIRGHDKRQSIVDYVVDENGCWIWQLATRGSGNYGTLKVAGSMQMAHRVYYERFVGPIPEGLQLDHLCRVKACVNPDHLEPVTNAENQRRGKGAKLTLVQVREIRTSDEPQRAIARQFGVDHSLISRIRNGEKWKEVVA